MFKKNCCDGIYNSFDVHFTSACDNKCKHCIDLQYCGKGLVKPDVKAIAKTIIQNQEGYDDVLFLGGEPCLFLEELIDCIKAIKTFTRLKVFVTTSVPKVCSDNYSKFLELLDLVDGINLSVQHYKEEIADQIRCTKSQFDRQLFYRNLPYKEKIRINLNIVKPFLCTRDEIFACLTHYDKMGFNSIKLSEIQHGTEHFVSFEKEFGIKLPSPYSRGCQTYLDKNLLSLDTPILLKRSCFLCESTLKASFLDGIKVAARVLKPIRNAKYGVIYEDGTLTKGWI